MPSLNIVVTGGSGFIGSHVVDALVDDGHRVTVLDLRPAHRSDVASAATDVSDLDGLTAAFAGQDFVFHLAAVSDINVALAHPVETVQINIAGTANVWEAARRAGVQRAVLASTVWVYTGARGPGPFDEDAPFHIPSAGHVYTSSKIAAEMLVNNYAEQYDQRFTIMRYGIPYGPRMRPELVIARFVRQALEGRPITINGDGSQYRNYVWIGDLVDAHRRVLAPVAENETFNLEGTERVTVRRMADTIIAAVGGAATVTYVPTRTGDYPGKDVSADKAHRLLGWRSSTLFTDGIERYIESFRAGLEPVTTGANT
jgi:UDP-glucose 4-epimerase